MLNSRRLLKRAKTNGDDEWTVEKRRLGPLKGCGVLKENHKLHEKEKSNK